MRDFIDVAVLAVRRRSGAGSEVLITRRGPTGHLPGLWELPGGKVGAGESPQAAAARELVEETGLSIDPDDLIPLPSVEHDYPDRSVRLHPFLGTLPDGSEVDAERCEHRWVGLAEFAAIPFPPANAPITLAVIAALDPDSGIAQRRS